jgi:hypothetical protein
MCVPTEEEHGKAADVPARGDRSGAICLVRLPPASPGDFALGDGLRSREMGHGVPIFRKPQILRREIILRSFHPESRETNPFIADRTASDEPSPIPPGADQRFVYPFCVTVKLKLEVNPLHPMRTTRMRTLRFIVMDMRRRHGAESTFTVEAIERFQFSRRNC